MVGFARRRLWAVGSGLCALVVAGCLGGFGCWFGGCLGVGLVGGCLGAMWSLGCLDWCLARSALGGWAAVDRFDFGLWRRGWFWSWRRRLVMIVGMVVAG